MTWSVYPWTNIIWKTWTFVLNASTLKCTLKSDKTGHVIIPNFIYNKKNAQGILYFWNRIIYFYVLSFFRGLKNFTCFHEYDKWANRTTITEERPLYLGLTEVKRVAWLKKRNELHCKTTGWTPKPNS